MINEKLKEKLRRHAASLALVPDELPPIPTKALPHSFPADGICAVIFDIYGTLLISRAGDIGITGDTPALGARNPLLNKIASQIDISSELKILVKEVHNRKKADGIAFPEVDILELWKKILEKCHLSADVSDEELLCLGIDYELAINPVAPMPLLQEALRELKEDGYLLGIVSNAQFYTPLLLEGLLGGTLDDFGFDEALISWSYKVGISKPDKAIYEPVVTSLNKFGISPSSALYVGNDMLNDMYGASQMGMRTALFAGDKRSLRLRSDDDRCKDLKPDMVITDLDQLMHFLG